MVIVKVKVMVIVKVIGFLLIAGIACIAVIYKLIPKRLNDQQQKTKQQNNQTTKRPSLIMVSREHTAQV